MRGAKISPLSEPFPRRLGTAESLASLAIELIENGYMNGETVRMDGALRMAPRQSLKRIRADPIVLSDVSEPVPLSLLHRRGWRATPACPPTDLDLSPVRGIIEVR